MGGRGLRARVLAGGRDNAVAWCTPGDALHAANVARRFEVELDIFSDLSAAPATDAEVVVLTGEPYYHDLEGHPVACALRFWRRCSMLRELFSGRRVRVARPVVVAVAIRSEDLKKARAAATRICGASRRGGRGVARGAPGLVPIDLDEQCGVVAGRDSRSGSPTGSPPGPSRARWR